MRAENSHPRSEVALISLGGDQSGAVANLVMHLLADPIPLLLVLHTPLPPIQMALLEKLTDVRVLYVGLGLGRARGHALADAMGRDVDVLVMIDDDALIWPLGGFRLLAWWAWREATWCVPIIRYAANFVDGMGLPDHTEIWEPVDLLDSRVRASLEAYGPGWVRVYDTGQRIRLTDRMGGTCHAIPIAAVPPALLNRLAMWPQDAGQEDDLIGSWLGQGRVLGEVYAYHWGAHTPTKWKPGPVRETLENAGKKVPEWVV